MIKSNLQNYQPNSTFRHKYNKKIIYQKRLHHGGSVVGKLKGGALDPLTVMEGLNTAVNVATFAKDIAPSVKEAAANTYQALNTVDIDPDAIGYDSSYQGKKEVASSEENKPSMLERLNHWYNPKQEEPVLEKPQDPEITYQNTTQVHNTLNLPNQKPTNSNQNAYQEQVEQMQDFWPSNIESSKPFDIEPKFQMTQEEINRDVLEEQKGQLNEGDFNNPVRFKRDPSNIPNPTLPSPYRVPLNQVSSRKEKEIQKQLKDSQALKEVEQVFQEPKETQLFSNQLENEPVFQGEDRESEKRTLRDMNADEEEADLPENLRDLNDFEEEPDDEKTMKEMRQGINEEINKEENPGRLRRMINWAGDFVNSLHSSDPNLTIADAKEDEVVPNHSEEQADLELNGDEEEDNPNADFLRDMNDQGEDEEENQRDIEPEFKKPFYLNNEIPANEIEEEPDNSETIEEKPFISEASGIEESTQQGKRKVNVMQGDEDKKPFLPNEGESIREQISTEPQTEDTKPEITEKPTLKESLKQVFEPQSPLKRPSRLQNVSPSYSQVSQKPYSTRYYNDAQSLAPSKKQRAMGNTKKFYEPAPLKFQQKSTNIFGKTPNSLETAGDEKPRESFLSRPVLYEKIKGLTAKLNNMVKGDPKYDAVKKELDMEIKHYFQRASFQLDPLEYSKSKSYGDQLKVLKKNFGEEFQTVRWENKVKTKLEKISKDIHEMEQNSTRESKLLEKALKIQQDFQRNKDVELSEKDLQDIHDDFEKFVDSVPEESWKTKTWNLISASGISTPVKAYGIAKKLFQGASGGPQGVAAQVALEAIPFFSELLKNAKVEAPEYFRKFIEGENYKLKDFEEYAKKGIVDIKQIIKIKDDYLKSLKQKIEATKKQKLTFEDLKSKTLEQILPLYENLKGLDFSNPEHFPKYMDHFNNLLEKDEEFGYNFNSLQNYDFNKLLTEQTPNYRNPNILFNQLDSRYYQQEEKPILTKEDIDMKSIIDNSFSIRDLVFQINSLIADAELKGKSPNVRKKLEHLRDSYEKMALNEPKDIQSDDSTTWPEDQQKEYAGYLRDFPNTTLKTIEHMLQSAQQKYNKDPTALRFSNVFRYKRMKQKYMTEHPLEKSAEEIHEERNVEEIPKPPNIDELKTFMNEWETEHETLNDHQKLYAIQDEIKKDKALGFHMGEDKRYVLNVLSKRVFDYQEQGYNPTPSPTEEASDPLWNYIKSNALFRQQSHNPAHQIKIIEAFIAENPHHDDLTVTKKKLEFLKTSKLLPPSEVLRTFYEDPTRNKSTTYPQPTLHPVMNSILLHNFGENVTDPSLNAKEFFPAEQAYTKHEIEFVVRTHPEEIINMLLQESSIAPQFDPTMSNAELSKRQLELEKEYDNFREIWSPGEIQKLFTDESYYKNFIAKFNKDIAKPENSIFRTNIELLEDKNFGDAKEIFEQLKKIVVITELKNKFLPMEKLVREINKKPDSLDSDYNQMEVPNHLLNAALGSSNVGTHFDIFSRINNFGVNLTDLSPHLSSKIYSLEQLITSENTKLNYALSQPSLTDIQKEEKMKEYIDTVVGAHDMITNYLNELKSDEIKVRAGPEKLKILNDWVHILKTSKPANATTAIGQNWESLINSASTQYIHGNKSWPETLENFDQLFLESDLWVNEAEKHKGDFDTWWKTQEAHREKHESRVLYDWIHNHQFSRYNTSVDSSAVAKDLYKDYKDKTATLDQTFNALSHIVQQRANTSLTAEIPYPSNVQEKNKHIQSYDDYIKDLKDQQTLAVSGFKFDIDRKELPHIRYPKDHHGDYIVLDKVEAQEWLNILNKDKEIKSLQRIDVTTQLKSGKMSARNLEKRVQEALKSLYENFGIRQYLAPNDIQLIRNANNKAGLLSVIGHLQNRIKEFEEGIKQQESAPSVLVLTPAKKKELQRKAGPWAEKTYHLPEPNESIFDKTLIPVQDFYGEAVPDSMEEEDFTPWEDEHKERGEEVPPSRTPPSRRKPPSKKPKIPVPPIPIPVPSPVPISKPKRKYIVHPKRDPTLGEPTPIPTPEPTPAVNYSTKRKPPGPSGVSFRTPNSYNPNQVRNAPPPIVHLKRGLVKELLPTPDQGVYDRNIGKAMKESEKGLWGQPIVDMYNDGRILEFSPYVFEYLLGSPEDKQKLLDHLTKLKASKYEYEVCVIDYISGRLFPVSSRDIMPGHNFMLFIKQQDWSPEQWNEFKKGNVAAEKAIWTNKEVEQEQLLPYSYMRYGRDKIPGFLHQLTPGRVHMAKGVYPSISNTGKIQAGAFFHSNLKKAVHAIKDIAKNDKFLKVVKTHISPFAKYIRPVVKPIQGFAHDYGLPTSIPDIKKMAEGEAHMWKKVMKNGRNLVKHPTAKNLSGELSAIGKAVKHSSIVKPLHEIAKDVVPGFAKLENQMGKAVKIAMPLVEASKAIKNTVEGVSDAKHLSNELNKLDTIFEVHEDKAPLEAKEEKTDEPKLPPDQN
jgi:hypothetical protein